MTWHFVSDGAHAPHSDQTLGPTPTRGRAHSARRLRFLASLCSSYVYKKPRLVPGKADREAQTQFLETYDHIRNL